MTAAAAAFAELPIIGGKGEVRGRGLQTNVLQFQEPAFWLFVALLALAALNVLTEQLTYLLEVPVAWLISAGLLALYVVPVALVIYYIDLFEPEPLSVLLAAFAWGGVIAVGFAGAANNALMQVLAKFAGPDFAQAWGAALIGPPVEETLKFLGVVTLYLIVWREVDDLIDGFVYGALIGLGFAAVENVQYFLGAVAVSGDQATPVVGMFVLRVLILGTYMHVLWSAIAGIGLAYYVTQLDQPRSKRLLWLVGPLALAMVAHAIWNSPLLASLVDSGLAGQLAFGLIKGSAFFIFLAVVVLLAQRREFGWFATIMAQDTGGDVITDDEVRELRSLFSRWRARRVMRRRKGGDGVRVHRRLQSEQLRLALLLSQLDDPLSDARAPDVETQRNVIRVLRAQLQGVPDVTPPTPENYSAALAAPVVAPSFVALSFMPGHRVPTGGVAARLVPDPAVAPVARIAAGAPVQVVERSGPWSKVMLASGWTGWVDARSLSVREFRQPTLRRLR